MISHRKWIFKLFFSVVESKLKRLRVKKPPAEKWPKNGWATWWRASLARAWAAFYHFLQVFKVQVSPFSFFWILNIISHVRHPIFCIHAKNLGLPNKSDAYQLSPSPHALRLFINIFKLLFSVVESKLKRLRVKKY